MSARPGNRGTSGAVLSLAWPQSTYLVDHAHRYVFCPVPKVVCTNLKKRVLELAGVADRHEHTGFNECSVHGDVHSCAARELALEPAETNPLEDSSYFRFAFVRNPWARLVSAYLDKIGRLANDVVGTHRDLVFAIQDRHGRPHDLHRRVSFREFVTFSFGLPDDEMDEHWRPQWSFLRGTHFDFVGRFERLEEHLDVVAARIGASLALDPGRNTVGYGALADSGHAADMDSLALDEWRAKHGGFPPYEMFYPDDLRGMVAGRYAADVHAFGYRFEDGRAP